MTDVREDPELWKELQSLFATEARRHLALVREDLSRLEAGPPSAVDLSEAVRAMHTLKGSAAMLGMKALGRTAGATEEVLDGLENGHTRSSAELLLRLSRAIDACATTVEQCARGRAPDECAHSFEVGRLRAAARAPTTEEPSGLPGGDPRSAADVARDSLPPEVAPYGGMGPRAEGAWK